MLKGKTQSGFKFEISDATLNNFELLEALSEMETNPLRLPTVAQLLLGEQKKTLFDHLRMEDGTVPIEDVERELMEIFRYNNQLKNS